jgi:hypothetical protein
MPINCALVDRVKDNFQFNYPSLTHLCSSKMASYKIRT